MIVFITIHNNYSCLQFSKYREFSKNKSTLPIKPKQIVLLKCLTQPFKRKFRLDY